MGRKFELSEVRIIPGDQYLVDSEEIDLLQGTIWFQVPKGYREFMSDLGDGVLDENIRIYTPKTILKDFAAHSQRMRDYWFWGEEPISQQMAILTIPVGGTLDGDTFIAHPGRPNEIFVLPSKSDLAIRVEGGLFELIESIRDSRAPEDSRLYVFESVNHNPRGVATGITTGNEGTAITELIEIVNRGRSWAEQHNAFLNAEEQVRKLVVQHNLTTGVNAEGDDSRKISSFELVESGINFSSDGFFCYYETKSPNGVVNGKIRYSLYDRDYGFKWTPVAK